MIEILTWLTLLILHFSPIQYVIVDIILERKYSNITNSIRVDITYLIFSLIPLVNYVFLFFRSHTYRYSLMSGRNDIVKCINCDIYTRRFYLINKNPIWKEKRWSEDGYENSTSEAKCPFCNSNNLSNVKNLNVTELPFGEKVPYFKALFIELFKFKTKQYKMDRLEEDRQTLQNTLNLIQQQSEAMDKLLENQKLNK